MFLDESGDIGFGLSQFFVVTAICTDNPNPLYNCIKHTRQKIKKGYKKHDELKFSASDKNVRNKILKCIGNNDINITYFILRSDDPISKDQSGEYIKNFSFIALITKTVSNLIASNQVNIIIDKYLPKKSIKDFNSALCDFNPDVKFTLQHSDSRSNKGVQIADFVAGAIHVNYRDRNPSFYRLISPKIKHSFQYKDAEEIYKDHSKISKKW